MSHRGLTATTILRYYAEEDASSYRAKFIVYRRSSLNDDTYEPVPGSVTTKTLLHSDVSEFRCRTEEVDSFEVQENDVVSACIEANNPLYLIGESNNESEIDDQNLYQYNRRFYEFCTNSQLMSVDTAHVDFILMTQHRLHLYVNIGMYLSHALLYSYKAFCIINLQMLQKTFVGQEAILQRLIP